MSEEHYEHNPGDHEDPLAGPTWMVSFIGVVLLVVTFLGLTSVYYSAQVEDADAKSSGEMTETLEAMRREQMKWLEHDATLEAPFHNPAWVRTDIDGDGDYGDEERIIIPIDLAIDKIAARYGGGG